jgi:hypothetical protein
MSNWQGSDPRAPGGGMEALDDRREYVGRTLVNSDRHGPYQFWRGGAEVGCVCDPDSGPVCAFHSHQETPPVVYQDDRCGYWVSSPIRFGMVRWHSTVRE